MISACAKIPTSQRKEASKQPIINLWFDKQDGSRYKQGEKIIIKFEVNTDGYVTLYDIDTKGNVHILFPNKHVSNNQVKGEKLYKIPDEKYSYDLVIEGDEGVEYIHAVVSTDPYYHWNYKKGVPGWLRDWGVKGHTYDNIPQPTSVNYKDSFEYKNLPSEFSDDAMESAKQNFAISQQIQRQIHTHIAARSPEIQYKNYRMTTGYFYHVSSQTSGSETTKVDTKIQPTPTLAPIATATSLPPAPTPQPPTPISRPTLTPTPIPTPESELTDKSDLAKNLIVKVTGDNISGSGIVFGQAGDILFIVTANHVVRRGRKEAQNVRVEFKFWHEKIEATLLEQRDRNLDVAVLLVNLRKSNLSHSLLSTFLPLAQLQYVSDVAGMRTLYPVGHPPGADWYTPKPPPQLYHIEGETVRFHFQCDQGYSGGGLFNEEWGLIGMIVRFNPPVCEAVSFERIRVTLKSWRLPVNLQFNLTTTD